MGLKLTPEGVQSYIDRIQAAWGSDYVTGWEMDFLSDMEEQFMTQKYISLSDKQWNRLNIILEKCNV